MPYDIFISYRRADCDRVLPLVEILRKRGLTVWMDQREIEDFTSITASIRDGLSNSKALVAWFSAIYPLSRPCQWELTAAFIAAQQEGDPRRRVLIINPERSPDHIYLPQLKDEEYLGAPAAGDSKGYDDIADRLVRHLSGLGGNLGDIRALVGSSWYPAQATGSNRFVGRLKEMWEIHRGLWESQTIIDRLGRPAVVRLTGMGGTGKSLLAAEYALRFGAAYPGGVFWLTVQGARSESTDPQSIELTRDSLYRTIASLLQIDAKDKNTDTLQGEMGKYLGLKAMPFLWVVDDVPAGVPVRDLSRWYAPHPLGRTLITTRSLEYEDVGQEVEIDQLDPGAAKELLAKRRPPRDDAEKRAIDPILRHLGYHALAVDVAGARLETTSYASFLERLEDPGNDALELAAKFSGQLPNGHEASIAKTLLQSLGLLDDDARDFLRLAAFLPVYWIPAALVAGVFGIVHNLGEGDARDRADLAIHGVKLQSPAEGRGDEDFSVIVHILVSRMMRFSDTLPGRLEVLRSAAISSINRMLPEVADIRNHPRLESWVIHARHLTEKVDTAEEAELLGWVGRFEEERRVFSQAAFLYRKQFEAMRKIRGEEHPATLTSMNALGNAYHGLGEYRKAMEYHEKALALELKLYPDGVHPAILKSYRNLSIAYWAAGEPGLAAEYAKKGDEIEAKLKR